jgi:hypothetical protein
VFFLGWSLSAIMILYWSENVLIGFYNILKMALARGKLKQGKYSLNKKPVKESQRIYLIGFFTVHFGLFTLGHAAFVFSFFGKETPSFKTLFPAVFSLFISHGISFFSNFIQNGEYKRVAFPDLFFQPYKRVVLMHLTIIFGAWMALMFESPPMVLVILITLKIILDIYAHRKEHKKFAAAAVRL